MSVPTNAQRAERAFRITLVYQGWTGADGEDAETLIVDIVADLMHEVRMHQGDNFEEILERARVHHDAERDDDAENPENEMVASWPTP